MSKEMLCLNNSDQGLIIVMLAHLKRNPCYRAAQMQSTYLACERTGCCWFRSWQSPPRLSFRPPLLP